MILQKVRYANFRNIINAELVFSEGINLLYGDNAQGKTNALEGICLCAQGRSHRTAKERDYILYGEDFAKVTLTYKDAERCSELEMRYLKSGRKIVKKDGFALRKMSEFIGNFKAVLFCPEHLSIIRDGPAERRNYMDNALSQTDRVYLRELQKYNAALMQRNRLIAEYAFSMQAYTETADVWAEQLCESGEILSEKRAEYMEMVSKETEELFAAMTAGGEKPKLIYRKPMKKEELKALFESGKERELKAGTTLFGIHKDDIEILLNDRPARVFASQGQQRSLAVAMKLAEGAVCRKMTGEYPVFLLDDVLSEFDRHRKEFILSGLRDRQVIVTCCDEADAEKFKNGRVIRVEKGQYTTVR